MQRKKQDTKNKALVIAVSEYQHPDLKGKDGKGLNFCENDGREMSRILESRGYQVYDRKELIGEVKFSEMRESIYDFFTNKNISGNDTLLFYYSGHGIPDSYDDTYLASSEIDPELPGYYGFSFSELTKMINITPSAKVVCILDCCYSGAAKLSKGSERTSVKIATRAIRNTSDEALKQGKAKCLLAASQAAQEAYAKKKADHSVFTYYLLEGFKGKSRYVDDYGNVTADTLARYVYQSIMNLPPKERPKQEPIKKIEAGDDIVLARYPNLGRRRAPRVSSYKEESDLTTNKYMDTIWKTYSRLIDFIKIYNLITSWLHKFQTNSPLSLTDIDSFEKEFFLGELHLWLTTEKNPSMAKVITDELLPKIVRLRKLHQQVGSTSISRDQKKRIIRMQQRIGKAIREVYRFMPP